mmetsp:Transcript_101043/g.286358  ORF Transcript_101043/g.286358 Transcript_101043/m.286358 type:complete len:208 (-) Transcript_101043:773-1396(-)
MKTARRTSAGSNSPAGRSASSSSTTAAGGGPVPRAPRTWSWGKLFCRSRTLRAAEATAAATRSRKYSLVRQPSSFCARHRNFRSGCAQTTSAQRRAPRSRLQFPRRSTESTGSGPACATVSSSPPPASPGGATPPIDSARAMLPRSWMKLSQSSRLVSRGRLPRLAAMLLAPSSPMLFEATAMCTTLQPASTSASNNNLTPRLPKRL